MTVVAPAILFVRRTPDYQKRRRGPTEVKNRHLRLDAEVTLLDDEGGRDTSRRGRRRTEPPLRRALLPGASGHRRALVPPGPPRRRRPDPPPGPVACTGRRGHRGAARSRTTTEPPRRSNTPTPRARRPTLPCLFHVAPPNDAPRALPSMCLRRGSKKHSACQSMVPVFSPLCGCPNHPNGPASGHRSAGGTLSGTPEPRRPSDRHRRRSALDRPRRRAR